MDEVPDPRPLPAELARGPATSRPPRRSLPPPPRRFLHGDSQATNVMVAFGAATGGTPEYLAVPDWGGCGWGDPAWDFAGVPLRVVPAMLEGYGTVAPFDGGEDVEARVLWRHLRLSLYPMRRGPQPGRSS